MFCINCAGEPGKVEKLEAINPTITHIKKQTHIPTYKKGWAGATTHVTPAPAPVLPALLPPRVLRAGGSPHVLRVGPRAHASSPCLLLRVPRSKS